MEGFSYDLKLTAIILLICGICLAIILFIAHIGDRSSPVISLILLVIFVLLIYWILH